MINIKFKNEKSLFIGGDDVAVKAERVTKKIEKYIRKGRCAKADKTNDGYNFNILDYDYSYQDYHIEVGEHTNSEYARESERLYKLANTKEMKKKFIKTEKDIYTKPSKIFKRNFSELVGGYSDLFILTFGASAILSLFLTLPVGICFDFSLPVSILISGSPLIAQLSTFLAGIPLVNTIKELKQNKKSNKKDDEVSESDKEEKATVKKVNLMKPNKIKGLDDIKEISVVKNNSQEMLAKTRKQKAIILFLKNKYRELDERRIELINNGGSNEEIIQVVNEMNALAYKANTIIPSSTEEEVVEEKPMCLELK